MAEVGSHFWRSTAPTPPLNTGPPRVSCPGPCPDSFWVSPGMETPQPFWAICASALLCHLQSEKKILFYYSQKEFPLFLFVVIAFCSVTGNWEESGPVFYSMGDQVCAHTDMPPWAFSAPGWTVPAFSVSLHRRDASVHHHCGPLLGLHQDVCDFLVLGSSELDPSLQICFTRTEQKGRITSLKLLVMIFLKQTRMQFTSIASRTHCWSICNLLPTRNPQELACSPQLGSTLHCCAYYFSPSAEFGLSL